MEVLYVMELGFNFGSEYFRLYKFGLELEFKEEFFNLGAWKF